VRKNPVFYSHIKVRRRNRTIQGGQENTVLNNPGPRLSLGKFLQINLVVFFIKIIKKKEMKPKMKRERR